MVCMVRSIFQHLCATSSQYLVNCCISASTQDMKISQIAWSNDLFQWWKSMKNLNFWPKVSALYTRGLSQSVCICAKRDYQKKNSEKNIWNQFNNWQKPSMSVRETLHRKLTITLIETSVCDNSGHMYSYTGFKADIK